MCDRRFTISRGNKINVASYVMVWNSRTRDASGHYLVINGKQKYSGTLGITLLTPRSGLRGAWNIRSRRTEGGGSSSLTVVGTDQNRFYTFLEPRSESERERGRKEFRQPNDFLHQLNEIPAQKMWNNLKIDLFYRSRARKKIRGLLHGAFGRQPRRRRRGILINDLLLGQGPGIHGGPCFNWLILTILAPARAPIGEARVTLVKTASIQMVITSFRGNRRPSSRWKASAPGRGHFYAGNEPKFISRLRDVSQRNDSPENSFPVPEINFEMRVPERVIRRKRWFRSR